MKYLGNTGLTKLIALINEKFAPLNSPAITGTPTAPTPAANDNSTRVATTEFVKGAISDIDIEKLTTEEIYGIFGIAMPVTVTIEQSEHQTIHVTVNGTDHTETFTALIGAEYTVTVVPDTGYTAGTVTNTSGTISEAMTVSATAATIIQKTSLNISSYAQNNITDYQTITTLPQTNIEELTNIVPMAEAGWAFAGCEQLTSLNGVEQTWDTSNVTHMNNMFNGCYALTTLNTSNWNTSNVTSMGSMFDGCVALISLDLSNWNTSKVTNMSSIFCSCNALISLDLSNWNTSKVTNMSYIFSSCNNLQYLIIGSSTFKFRLLENVFLNNTCKILVPQALISTYQAATNWSDHASQFEPIENYTITRSNGQVTVTPNT